MKLKERIEIRVSKEDKLRLQGLASKYNISLSQYLISAGLNRSINVRRLPDYYTEKLKNEIAQIGRNLWVLIKNKKKLQLADSFRLEENLEQLHESIHRINNHYDC